MSSALFSSDHQLTIPAGAGAQVMPPAGVLPLVVSKSWRVTGLTRGRRMFRSSALSLIIAVSTADKLARVGPFFWAPLRPDAAPTDAGSAPLPAVCAFASVPQPNQTA